MHEDAVRPGERVLVVDDVIATGGTARAVAELARGSGPRWAAGVPRRADLPEGRERLGGREARSLIRY